MYKFQFLIKGHFKQMKAPLPSSFISSLIFILVFHTTKSTAWIDSFVRFKSVSAETPQADGGRCFCRQGGGNGFSGLKNCKSDIFKLSLPNIEISAEFLSRDKNEIPEELLK